MSCQLFLDRLALYKASQEIDLQNACSPKLKFKWCFFLILCQIIEPETVVEKSDNQTIYQDDDNSIMVL